MEAEGEGSGRDSLDVYMAEVRKLPLLGAEEEHQLAMRFAAERDPAAAGRLVASHLRLVLKIAFEYRRAGLDVLDLVQEGNLGLWKAIQRFDPHRGVRLATYACHWIRADILRFVLSTIRLVKMGTTLAERRVFFSLARERARLAASGIEPSAEAVGARMSVDASVVREMGWRLSAPDASLDAPIFCDGDRGTTRGDLLGGADTPIDDVLCDRQLRSRLHEEMRAFAATLENRERCVFEERLLSDEPVTLQEIASRFGVSRERIRQIESQLLVRLRTRLSRGIGAQLLQEPGGSVSTSA